MERARDNVQILLNDIMLNCPRERVEDVLIAKLPFPTTVLPREKPLPKAKPLTKWEEFAKSKGIQKKGSKEKKGKLVWDDAVREWIPKYGYKKAQAEVQKTWCIEAKGNEGPSGADHQDPFEKMAEEKRERMAKNETQRLRNLARAKNVSVPAMKSAVLPNADKNKSGGGGKDLAAAADLAQKSTASLGKFQKKLSNKMEKEAGKKLTPHGGKKRKFEPTIGDGDKEKANNLKILETIGAKKQKIDMTKAVGRQLQTEERQRSESKTSGGRGGKARKNKGKSSGKFSKKAAKKAAGKGTKRR